MENNNYLPINTNLLFEDNREVAECIQCRNTVYHHPSEEVPFCSDECADRYYTEENWYGKYGHHGEYL